MGKSCDFAWRLPLKPSTLNLFNRVVYFYDASGFNGYVESVKIYNYYISIQSGPIAAQMTYLCEKYKILKRRDNCTIIWTDPEMKSSFTLRWHHERTRHWIN